MYILATYDVNTIDREGQRRLSRVAKACKDYGQRVQNSVFECELTGAQFCLLKERLRNIIDMEKDSIRFYQLNKNKSSGIELLGRETSYDVAGPIII